VRRGRLPGRLRGTIGAVTETGETFTCESCGETFPKGWSDEEAAAEAEELFPGMDLSDPAEAAVVCDACYQHLMGRARAEAPELIGEGWRGSAPQVLEDGSLLYDAVVPGGSFLAGFGRRGADSYPFRSPLSSVAARSEPGPFGSCYTMPSGSLVHVRPGCRCR
jgi:hypothetical protein